MRLEIRHLELLLAVERAASISGAARALGTDQGGVSRALHRIEEHVGSPVFHRGPDGVRPTATGREVLERARTAVAGLARLQDRSERRGELRVAVWDAQPDFVVELEELRPGLVVATTAMEGDDALDSLLSGGSDAVVSWPTPHNPQPQRDGVTSVEVRRTSLVVALPADHPLAAAAVVDLHDLRDADWVAHDSADYLRFLQHECRAVGGFEPRVRHRGTEDVGRMLREGRGVGLGMDLSTLAPDCVLRPYTGATPWPVRVHHVRGRADEAVVADLVEAVRRAARTSAAEFARYAARFPGYAPWVPAP